MDSISSTPQTSAVETMLTRNAEGDTAKSVAMLKTALKADQNMVQQLLVNSQSGGQVDIKA